MALLALALFILVAVLAPVFGADSRRLADDTDSRGWFPAA